MLVFRIEHPSDEFNDRINRGAYSSQLATYLLSHEAYFTNNEVSPLPKDDVRLAQVWHSLTFTGNYKKYVFAFESIESLLRWFHKPERLAKYSDNYLLVQYELEDSLVSLGTAQCIFHSETTFTRTVLDNTILFMDTPK